MSELTMDTLVSLCKRRGFVFQSSEIYGGLASAWDYGPLGVELKNNIQRFWWKQMTQLHDNIVGLDAAILMHPRVWEASGHVENFTRPHGELQEVQAALPRGRNPRGAVGQARVPGVRRPAHRAAAVQPDVQDPHGPGGGRHRGWSTCARRPPRAST